MAKALKRVSPKAMGLPRTIGSHCNVQPLPAPFPAPLPILEAGFGIQLQAPLPAQVGSSILSPLNGHIVWPVLRGTSFSLLQYQFSSVEAFCTPSIHVHQQCRPFGNCRPLLEN
jgi:hypothetical protein